MIFHGGEDWLAGVVGVGSHGSRRGPWLEVCAGAFVICWNVLSKMGQCRSQEICIYGPL